MRRYSRPAFTKHFGAFFSTQKVLNYFEVFNIPPTFHLNMARLEASFKSLQKQLHPDLNHQASGSRKEATAGAIDSSVVNHAYQVSEQHLRGILCGIKIVHISIRHCEILQTV